MRIVLGVTTFALCAALFTSGTWPALGPWFIVFLLAALVAEGMSVRLPYFGTISFGLVVYLPLICLPEYGPRAAIGAALVAITAREIASFSTFTRLLDELILDLLPLTLASYSPLFLEPDDPEPLLWLAAGLTFVTARHLEIRLLGSALRKEGGETVKRLQRNTANIRWGLLGLSFVAVSVAAQNPLFCLALVPILISLRQAAIHAYAWLDTEDKKRLRAEAGQLSKSLLKAESRISNLSNVLETTENERDLLYTLSRETADCRSLGELLLLVEKMCRSLGLGGGVQLVFREHDGWLFLRLDDKRRPATSLQKYEELGPGFKKAWKLDKRCVAQKTGRVYEPMPGVGVLSFQRVQDSNQDMARLFATQVALACLSARRFEMVERAMAQLSDFNENLRQRNQHLVALTHHLKELSACKTLDQACKKLPETGRLLVGAQHLHSVVLRQEDQTLFEWESGTRQEATQRLSASLDEEHAFDVRFSGSPADEEFVGVGFQCTREILSQILLSRSLQEALEQLKASEAQLIQNAKLAAVGQLSAGLAHEINNPLGSIRLAIEVTLRKEQLADFTRDLLSKALAGVQRAERITGSLLSYSRAGDKGKVKMQAWQVLLDACSFMRSSLHVQNVALEVPSRGEETVVLANPQEVQQIITNLVMNARDAVENESKPKVVVKAERTAGEFVVQVHDNGPGVPKDVADRVFDPFFTTKAVGKGTGLGLSVSRELAENNGGSLVLAAESPLGGACFELRLPVLD